MDKPPTNYQEYLERTGKHTHISGYGLDVTSHYPCPFCGAPGWASHKLMEIKEVMSKEHTCSECGRSAKLIFTEEPGSTSFELVQTGGDDPADWFTHNPRRIDNGDDA